VYINATVLSSGTEELYTALVSLLIDSEVIDEQNIYGMLSTDVRDVSFIWTATPGVHSIVIEVKTHLKERDASNNMVAGVLYCNILPTAIINATTTEEYTLNNITFSALKSYDTDGNITSYLWDFGDGNTSREALTNHSYAHAGVYTVLLTVTDDTGMTSSAHLNITVLNRPPYACINISGEMYAFEPVIFNANGSADPDGWIANFTWFFGDGEAGYGRVVSHIYTHKGEYSVLLIVADDMGAVNSTRAVVSLSNHPPYANISANNSAYSLEKVHFSAFNSSDRDGYITLYKWDFGDGEVGFGMNTTHTYLQPGNYTVTLSVWDNDGAQSACHKSIEILNRPPVADAGGSITADSLIPVLFSGTASYDVDGHIVRYLWEFSDGTSAEGCCVYHTFNKSGVYNVQLTVWDNYDAFSTDAILVNVKNRAPEAFVCEAKRGTTLSEILFAGNGTDRDGYIVEYLWNFGDGTMAVGKEVTHAYRDDGEYTVTLTVRDNQGATASAITYAFISNRAPAVIIPTTLYTNKNSRVTFDATDSYDPDGAIASYRWDFGDGSYGSGAITSHIYKKGGTYRVLITIYDDDNTCNWSVMEVIVREHAPVIVDRAPSQPNITLGIGDVMEFWVWGADKDNDTLIYSWSVDGGCTCQYTHSYTLDASTLLPGKHEISARVSDGTTWDEYVWLVSIEEQKEEKPTPQPTDTEEEIHYKDFEENVLVENILTILFFTAVAIAVSRCILRRR